MIVQIIVLYYNSKKCVETTDKTTFASGCLRPEVGKAQLEAQSATSAPSAIAGVALRLIFLF